MSEPANQSQILSALHELVESIHNRVQVARFFVIDGTMEPSLHSLFGIDKGSLMSILTSCGFVRADTKVDRRKLANFFESIEDGPKVTQYRYYRQGVMSLLELGQRQPMCPKTFAEQESFRQIIPRLTQNEKLMVQQLLELESVLEKSLPSTPPPSSSSRNVPTPSASTSRAETEREKRQKTQEIEEPTDDIHPPPTLFTMKECGGLRNKRVNEYASKGSVERGFLLEHFDFCHEQWRAKGCTLIASKNEIKCKPCSAATHNINRERIPELFQTQEDSSQDISPERRERRQSAGSNYPFTFLSPASKTIRYRNVVDEKKKIKKRLERLKRNIEKSKNKIGFVEHDIKGREFVKEVLDSVTSSPEETIQLLMKHVLEISIPQSCSEEERKEKETECEELVQEMWTEICNQKRILEGKPKQVRFSSAILRTCMSIYAGSKARFREMKDLSPWILPSERHLNRLVSKVRVGEGKNPLTLAALWDQRQDFDIREEIQGASFLCAGLLEVDEIKVRSGIAFNTSNHSFAGVVSDSTTIDLSSELKQILKQDTNESDTFGAVESANVFRFRSLKNKKFNCTYFFNAGKLSGEVLMEQLLHTIRGLEFIGVKIYGVCLDAGGGNARAVRLLTGQPSVDSVWPVDRDVSFKNPADPSRRVAIFHCMTHNAKAFRNVLYNSTSARSRTLSNPKTGQTFGWQIIQDCFEREKERGTTMRTTRITQDVVYPDHWSVMNVSSARIPFEWNTIMEIAGYLAGKWGIMSKLSFDTGGVESEGKALLRTVRVFEEEASNHTLELDTYEGLRYLIYTSIIFNYCFQQRQNQLTIENWSSLKGSLMPSLRYYQDWLVSIHEKVKETGAKGWDRWFLPAATWRNIRVGASGFFLFAKLVLQDPDLLEHISYVPFLYANQSDLEAFFSWLRQSGQDNVISFGKGFGAANTIHRRRSFDSQLQRGSQYSQTDLLEDKGSETLQQPLLMNNKEREAWSARQRQAWKEQSSSRVPSTIKVFAEVDRRLLDVIESGTAKSVFNRLLEKEIGGHYDSFLLKDDIFNQFLSLSYGITARQAWFESLLALNGESLLQLDSFCSHIFASFFQELVRGSTVDKAQSIDAILGVRVKQLEVERLQSLIDQYAPAKLVDRTCCSVLFEILASYFRLWLEETLPQPAVPAESSSSAIEDADLNSLVNRVVGWACDQVYGALLNTEGTFSRQVTKICELGDVQDFVQDMTMTLTEALQDEEYLRKYYPIKERIINRGGLSLVRKELFEFGRALMKRVTSVDVKKEVTKDKDALEQEYITIRECEVISSLFLKAVRNNSKVPQEVKLMVCERLCRKVFNAVVGREAQDYFNELRDRKSVAFRTGLKVGSKRGVKTASEKGT